jgi:hypothetical protein
MISRATALAIACEYTDRFTSVSRSSYGSSEKVLHSSVYDFLYANDYEAWFCNLAKAPIDVRRFKEFWMQLHTGESIVSATDGWTSEQRAKLGQRLLRDLAQAHLRWLEIGSHVPHFGENYAKQLHKLQRRLELDGYIYKEGVLLQQGGDVLDVETERNALQALFQQAKLARSQDASRFLQLGEEHFVAERWSDCIANVRKFFELVLQEGARVLAASRGAPLADELLSRPVEVRQYLEREGLFERKEREVIDKVYGLLSETGAHPYMAESDQARLLRQLGLTIAQFVLLRLVAALSGGSGSAT